MIDPHGDARADAYAGEVELPGISNHVLRYLVARRCSPGDRVIDIGCGRGQQLSVLRRYRADLHSYTGLDSRRASLAEARDRAASSMGRPPFPITFRLCDIAAPWPVAGPFDVAVYTSVFEHLPQEMGLTNLEQRCVTHSWRLAPARGADGGG